MRNTAVYIALGIFPDGAKEILGIWIEQSEGTKFWLRVRNEPKSQGIADILKGFPDTINAASPTHCSRPASFTCCAMRCALLWKDRKPIVRALRAVSRATDLAVLNEFEAAH